MYYLHKIGTIMNYFCIPPVNLLWVTVYSYHFLKLQNKQNFVENKTHNAACLKMQYISILHK